MGKPLPFDVPADSVPAYCSSMRSARVVFPEPHVAVVEPIRSSRRNLRRVVFVGCALWSLVAGIVAAALTGLTPGTTPAFPEVNSLLIWMGALVMVLFGTLFVLLFEYVASRQPGAPRTVFDRRAGECVQYAPGAATPACAPLPLKSIAALQVIGTKSGFRALQLNMVLSDPPGARGNLMAHGDEKSLRTDAQALAAFLKVPVLEQ